MTKLKAVAPKTVAPSKPKFLVYGAAKTGKTFTAMDFPSVYYIDSERGATRPEYQDKLAKSGGVYVGAEQGGQSFDDVLEQVRSLATEKHNYKTLVIDSVTHLYLLEIEKEVARLGDKDAFGASKKSAIQKSRQLINLVNRLDMNVILIAHEKVKWEKQEQVGITFDGYEKLDYMLELTLHIRRQGDSRMALVKESRMSEFPMGTTFPWSYTEFAKRYGKTVMEQESKPIEVATPEQLSELKKLIDLLKVSEEEQDKWLKKAGVDELSDIDKEKTQAIIDMLKRRVAE